jgi:predicted GNAT family acetyltransferase
MHRKDFCMSDSKDIEVERRVHRARGLYAIRLPGIEQEAKLTWVERDGVRHAEHTFVPDAMRGQGIAGKLVDALIADAREQGFRIAPECSYVVAAFRRHPEWADLQA